MSEIKTSVSGLPIPQLNADQLDLESIGSVCHAVDQFRGAVCLPLNLVSLQSCSGMTVEVQALYSSNISDQAGTWNLDSPTGVLGLGWSLNLNQITVDLDGAAMTYGNTYTIRLGETYCPLIPIGPCGGDATQCGFQLREYQFWKVIYFSDKEKWEVTLPDGTVYVFGTENSNKGGIQWGIARGNWIGAGSNGTAASIPIAWNLVTVRNTWGDEIHYRYQNTDAALDDSTSYTQASYLSSITDSSGRRAQFNYAPKINTPDCQEYIPPHSDSSGSGLAVYQDRYETLYLQSIDISVPTPKAFTQSADSRADSLLLSVNFGYEVLCPSDNSNAAQLAKRYLTSVSKVWATGESLPGLAFSYDSDGNTPSGVLTGITYPTGAACEYTYTKQSLTNTNTELLVKAPVQYSSPRVWFGEDFTVVCWYGDGDDGNSMLSVSAYSWAGSWFNWELPSGINATGIDIDTLNVLIGDGFFGIFFTSESTDHLSLYRRDRYKYDCWDISTDYSFIRNNTSDTSVPTSIVAGDAFVALCNSTYQDNQVEVVYLGNDDDDPWNQMQNSVGSQYLTANGQSNWFVFSYVNQSNDMCFELWYYDNFKRTMLMGSNWPTSSIQVDFSGLSDNTWNETFISAGQTFFSLIWLIDAGQQEFGVRIYQWDSDFSVINDEADGSYDTQLTINSTDFPNLVAIGDQVCNPFLYLRYDGSNWNETPMSDDANPTSAAWGTDLFIVAQDSSVSGLRFDPANSKWCPVELNPTPDSATQLLISGQLLAVDKNIYYQGQESDWSCSLGELTGAISGSICLTPQFVTYETESGSDISTQIALLNNGGLVTPAGSSLSGQRVSVDPADQMPGRLLVGPGMFATYPAGGPIDEATSLTLHKVIWNSVDQNIEPVSVTGLTIGDGYQSYVNHYQYDEDTASTDPSGLIPYYSRVWYWKGSGDTYEDSENGATESWFLNGINPNVPGVFYPNEDLRQYCGLLSGFNLMTRIWETGGNGLELQSYVLNGPSVFPSKDEILGTYVRTTTARTVDEVYELAPLTSSSSIIDALNQATVPSDLETSLDDSGYELSDTSKVIVEVYGTSWFLMDPRNDWSFYLQLGDNLISVSAGICLTVNTEYNDSNGLPAMVWKTNVNADGTRQRYEEFVTYGIDTTKEGKTIYPGMVRDHLLTPVALRETKVGGRRTGAFLTTWREWGKRRAWAAGSQYRAITDHTTSNLTRGVDPSHWLLVNQVTQRSSSGQIIEQVTRGVTCSIMYDPTNSLPIAKFTNTSLGAGEGMYCGFQPYEDLSPWQMGDGSTPLNKYIKRGDAHSGRQSIEIPYGQEQADGLQTTVAITPTQTSYLLSLWYKTGAGFDSDDGQAACVVTGSQVTDITQDLPGAKGKWAHTMIPLVFDAALIGQPVTFQWIVYNGKQSQNILVDDLFMAPLEGSAESIVYDSGTWLPASQLGASGQTTTFVRDGRGQAILQSDVKGAPVRGAINGLSRLANSDQLSASAPNTSLNMLPSEGGLIDTFVDGEGWALRWTQDGSGWIAGNSSLHHTAGESSTITPMNVSTLVPFALQTRVIPKGSLSNPIQIGLGDAAIVRWSPGGDSEPGQWELVDPQSGQTLLDPVTPGPLFALPSSVFDDMATGTPSSIVSEAFASRGVSISQDSSTLTKLEDGDWVLDDSERFQTYLINTGNIHDGVVDISRLTLAPQVWTAIFKEREVLFYADGNLIFAWSSPQSLSGVPSITAQDAVALDFIAILVRPQVSVDFLNGTGRRTQIQYLDGTTVFMAGALFDDTGRLAATTKMATIENTLPGYSIDFFTGVDEKTGAAQGSIVQDYPDDQGYPLISARYEASPRSREIERGAPGADFAINPGNTAPHTTRTTYQTSDGLYDLPNGAFYLKTITDENGIQQQVITDKIGNAVYQTKAKTPDNTDYLVTALASTSYDETGTCTLTYYTPNYYAPPDGSTAEDWLITRKSNMLGQLVEHTSPDGGTESYMYDSGGRLRFAQNAVGGAADEPYIVYWKYDSIGRVIESGTTPSSWDVSSLQEKVDDSSWPDATTSWQQRLSYDGDGSDPTSVGRLVGVEINNACAEQADVTESYTYDLIGNRLTTSQTIDTVTATTVNEYDNLNRLKAIHYPDGDLGGSGTTVVYLYDERGLLVAVGSPSDDEQYAAYHYDGNGDLCREVLFSGSKPFERLLGYNSPSWLESVTDSLFSETVSFTEGGVNNAGFYDGSIAGLETTCQWDQGPGAKTESYDYALAGWMTDCEDSTASGPASWEYDPNGNISSIGGASCTYKQGTNQLEGIGADPQYSYDANGFVTSSTPLGITAIEYDPATLLAKSFELSGDNDVSQITLSYAVGSNRAEKTTFDSSGAVLQTKRYFRGMAPHVLTEQVTAADGTTSLNVYIYGARGLVAFCQGEDSYGVLLDRRGSVQALLDGAAEPVAAYTYSPWGAVQAYGNGPRLEYGFIGMEIDFETGLCSLGLRLYDPTLGRFYGPDPVIRMGSPYQYAFNNPHLFLDPTGAWSWKDWLLLGVGVAIGVGIILGGAGALMMAEDAALVPLELDDLEAAANAPLAENVPEAANAPLVENVPEAANAPLVENVPEAANAPLAENVPEAANAPLVENVPGGANIQQVNPLQNGTIWEQINAGYDLSSNYDVQDWGTSGNVFKASWWVFRIGRLAEPVIIKPLSLFVTGFTAYEIGRHFRDKV